MRSTDVCGHDIDRAAVHGIPAGRRRDAVSARRVPALADGLLGWGPRQAPCRGIGLDRCPFESFGLVDIDGEHLGAERGEGLGDGATETVAGAGDRRGLAGEIVAHGVSRRRLVRRCERVERGPSLLAPALLEVVNQLDQPCGQRGPEAAAPADLGAIWKSISVRRFLTARSRQMPPWVLAEGESAMTRLVTPLTSEAGRDARLGLMKTCQKLGLSLFDHPGDRLGVPDAPLIAPLPRLVRESAAT